MSTVQSGVVVVDDRDLRVDYTTAWYDDVPGQGADYNQTVTVSGNPNAGFQFQFNGTSVSVYGSIPPNNTAFSTFIVDLLPPMNYTNVPTDAYKSRNLCYQSPALPDGTHTLTVTIPNSVIGEVWTEFYFDFLTYVPSGVQTSATSSAAPGTTTTAVSRSKTSQTNLSVILPAVLVPCVVAGALLALGLYIMRRRIRHTLARRATPFVSQTSDASTRPLVSVTPAATTQSTPGLYHPASPSPSSASTSGAPGPHTAQSLSTGAVLPGASEMSSSVIDIRPHSDIARSDAADAGLERVREWQRRGGASILAASVATEEAPPTYRP